MGFLLGWLLVALRVSFSWSIFDRLAEGDASFSVTLSHRDADDARDDVPSGEARRSPVVLEQRNQIAEAEVRPISARPRDGARAGEHGLQFVRRDFYVVRHMPSPFGTRQTLTAHRSISTCNFIPALAAASSKSSILCLRVSFFSLKSKAFFSGQPTTIKFSTSFIFSSGSATNCESCFPLSKLPRSTASASPLLHTFATRAIASARDFFAASVFALSRSAFVSVSLPAFTCSNFAGDSFCSRFARSTCRVLAPVVFAAAAAAL